MISIQYHQSVAMGVMPDQPSLFIVNKICFFIEGLFKVVFNRPDHTPLIVPSFAATAILSYKDFP
jgi:hypothetical protein